MTFLTGLYMLFIRPLELLFEVVYVLAYRCTKAPVISIIFLSLAVNFLALPLYRRADMIQAAERDKEKSLERWIAHIKKTFKGDERFLMLQEFYRQNDYKPTHVVRGLLPLLLQIPFFTAAYRFLSGLTLLRGVSFGPIKDLGAPDAAFVIAGFTVNLLPILMTLINFVSGAIYTRGFPLKSKLQLYGMALIFLVLLYNSPAGLVFYWTLNNVFSLLKNVFYKLVVKDKVKEEPKKTEEESSVKTAGIDTSYKLIFIFSALFAAVLTGLFIPSSVIKASPLEFVNVLAYKNPLHYLWYSGLLAAGIFVVWFGVYFALAGDKSKKILSALSWMLISLFLFDYMFFGTKLGDLSSALVYNNGLKFKKWELPVNIIGIVLVLVLAFVLFRYAKGFVRLAAFTGVLVLLIISVMNIRNVNASMEKNFHGGGESEIASFSLSRDSKNVMVIMLDRAVGSEIPYILNERPDLKESFAGFTYYPNTMSYGHSTNFATPSLFGGYEYTPEKLNERSDEKLVDKHDEALKVMPVLFSEAGYDVTVCDPPYAGYGYVPDLSVFDDYPEIKTYITNGMFNDGLEAQNERTELIRQRNFLCYSFVKVAPVLLQRPLYNKGVYNEAYMLSDNSDDDVTTTVQVRNGLSKSYGLRTGFMNSYTVLTSLKEISSASNGTGSFIMLENETTHNPQMLQKPDYVPSVRVDNTAYDENDKQYYTIDGREMKMETEQQVVHYETNMAALLRLGEWFDYLREQGVYDNTRIIICSDHAYNIGQFDDMILNSEVDVQWLNPMLLVKDFDSTGFETDDSFMTLADVPILATDGVIENPVNPFTGNELTNADKYAGPQKVLFSDEWHIDTNNGNKFMPGDWYSVEENIYDMDNWKYLGNY